MRTKMTTMQRPAHHVEPGDVVLGTLNTVQRYLPVAEVKSYKPIKNTAPHGGVELFTEDQANGGGLLSIGRWQSFDPVRVAIVKELSE